MARTVKDTTPCILIVDDEPLNIRLLDIVLKKNGYRTLSCTSGPKARALAAEHNPDLILLDVSVRAEMKMMGISDVCECCFKSSQVA